MKLKWIGSHENTSGVSRAGEPGKPETSPDSALPAPEYASDGPEASDKKRLARSRRVRKNAPPDLTPRE